MKKDEIIQKFAKEKIKTLVTSTNKKLIKKLFLDYHAADIAEVVSELELIEQLRFIRRAAIDDAAEVISNLDMAGQVDIIKALKLSMASDVLEEMDDDDAVDILNDLSPEKVVALLAEMEQEEAEDLSELLTFDERTAGGLMTTDYMVIPERLTVAQAIRRIREQEPPDHHAFSYVYVVDANNKLVGYASLRDLLLAKQTTKVKKIREDNVISVAIDMDQEDVADRFSKYNLIAIPVVDHQSRLVGVVTSDDIVDVIEEESTEDMYKFTGATFGEETEMVEGKSTIAAVFRLPWLLITLLGGFLTSLIVIEFSASLGNLPISMTLILCFVPMLTGMGGNVGTQSSSITVRGLATGHIKMEKAFKHIMKEIMVGVILGLVLGLLGSLFSYFWQGNPYLGVIVGIAMCFNIITAATLGSIVPIMFKKIGIDPAIASAPFISTTIDAFGLFNYFLLVIFLVKIFY